jgi:HlyD family secretion protein
MKRALRILAIIGVLTLVAAVTIGAAQMQTSSADPANEQFRRENNIIDETIVTAGDLLVTVSATGSIEPLREAPLNFETNAVVSEALVEQGQFVRAGDVLARLDLDNLEMQFRLAEIDLSMQRVEFDDLVSAPRDVDVAAQEAALAAARAGAGAAYDRQSSANDIEIARLEAELADNRRWQSQIQRDQTLSVGPEFRDSGTVDARAQEEQLTGGIIGAEYQLEMERAQYTDVVNTGPDMQQLSQANADLVRAQIALDDLVNGPDNVDRRIAEASLELAELSLRQVELQLNDGVLVAPFDGIIAASNLTVGELPPQGAAITLIDASRLYIELPVDENDIRNVQVGQTVTLELDALPDATITGTVERVDTTPTQSGAVVTYIARVQVDPTEENIRIGMSATAEVIVEELEGAIMLENRFIRRDRATNRSTVTVVDDNGNLREVVVELGERNETESEIISGLTEGETVVLIQRETGALDN